MKLEEIRELVLLLEETSIAELELQREDFKLSLRKERCRPAEEVSYRENREGANQTTLARPLEKVADVDIVSVAAPMVGTFYAASAPDADPFVKIGDEVAKGQILCIVEAMKLMNEIKSEWDGTVVDIAVENDQPLEYGQTMFLIKKS